MFTDYWLKLTANYSTLSYAEYLFAKSRFPHCEQAETAVTFYASDIIILCYKKKQRSSEMRLIYYGRYGPIEKPYVRGLSRSNRVAEI